MLAQVEVAVGLRQAVLEQQIAGKSPGRHPPGPSDEMRRDVLEDGSADPGITAEEGMAPIAAGAHPPEKQRQILGKHFERPQRLFEIAGTEARQCRTATADAAEVERQSVVAGRAQGRETAAAMKVGLSPGDPGMDEEDGSARDAGRRIPGGGEVACAFRALDLETRERRQLGRRVTRLHPFQAGREGPEEKAGQAFLPPGRALRRGGRALDRRGE